MPKGTRVDKMYDALVAEGMDKGKAARIAQAKTGLALATGKPPRKSETVDQFIKRRNKQKRGK